jgi:hypothetical protein
MRRSWFARLRAERGRAWYEHHGSVSLTTRPAVYPLLYEKRRVTNCRELANQESRNSIRRYVALSGEIADG